MKYGSVLGFLPIFFIEKQNHKTPTKNIFLFVSEVGDLNDEIQIAHETTVMRYNYMVIILAIILSAMSLAISVYAFIILFAMYSVVLYVLYMTDVGEYRRDLHAYRVSIKMFSEKFGVSQDIASAHYASIMIESGKYDDYIRFKGIEEVIEDLKH